MKKYGFVYLWRDRKYPRYYIGCHWGTEDDKYICSSRWMRDAYRRRPNDFKRRILVRVWTSKQDLLIEEGKWLALILLSEIKVKYYNLHNFQSGHWTANEDRALSVREKLSKSQKKRFENLEERKAVSERILKYHADHPEQGANHSRYLLQYFENPESIEKNRAAQIKYYVDHPEASERMSKSQSKRYMDHPEGREIARKTMEENRAKLVAGLRGKSKLTLELVECIKHDKRTHVKIAEDYGISSSYVCMLKSGKRWKTDPRIG